MTWNYRVVQRTTEDGPLWTLHEVYYNDEGAVIARTQDPVDFGSDVSVQDLVASLEMALDDARNREVLVETGDEPWIGWAQ